LRLCAHHHHHFFFAPPRSSLCLRRRAHHRFCAAALFIIFAPLRSSSSLSRPSRDHPHSPIARVRANLFCRIQRVLILPLTLTSFSLPAAKVALIVAPSRSVDCRVFEVALVVVPSRLRA